ncbi:MAG: hypothetical protein ACLQVD_07495 [Capsulimonadaceae bacterium]
MAVSHDTVTMDLGHPDNIAELTRRGLAIYDANLKLILEPEHNGEYVALHVGTGNYYIGKTASAASRELFDHHPPDGKMVLRKIGMEPEYGLIARLNAGDPASADIK